MKPGWLEWVARGLAAAACAFFVAFAIGEGVPDLRRGADPVLVLTLLLIGAAVLATGLAYARPREGGAALVAAALALGLNALLAGGAPGSGRAVRAGLVYAVPFLLPGVLFLAVRAGRRS
jgi:hypothetical protein